MSWLKQNKELAVLTGVFFLFLVMVMPQTGFGWDMWCWQAWARDIKGQGLEKIYDTGCNYMPLYLYVLKLHGLLFSDHQEMMSRVYLLKGVTLFFEMCGVLLVLKSVNQPNKKYIHWAFLALNFSFLYNTLFWGQVDGILAFFVFASVYAAFKNRLWLAAILFLIAINFKFQAIVIAPLLLATAWPYIKSFGIKKTSFTILSVVAIQWVILLPFNIHGVWKVVKESVGYFDQVSMNAFNWWYYFFPQQIDVINVSDTTKYGILSLKNWGLLAFCSSIAAMFFLAYRTRLSNVFRLQNFPQLSFQTLALIGSLICLCFFYFPTEMHERYSHPAWLFLAAYCFSSRFYSPFFLFSFAYFLNMEKVLQYYHLKNYKTFIFSPQFIATLYLSIILILFWQLYKTSFSKETAQPK